MSSLWMFAAMSERAYVGESFSMAVRSPPGASMSITTTERSWPILLERRAMPRFRAAVVAPQPPLAPRNEMTSRDGQVPGSPATRRTDLASAASDWTRPLGAIRGPPASRGSARIPVGRGDQGSRLGA
jgi:hypothetical protein